MAAVNIVNSGVKPVATTLTTLYTAPSTVGTPPHTTKSHVTKVVATNLGAATTVRIAVSPGGAAIDDTHYFHYDNPLAVGESKDYVLDVDISGTDIVRAYSASGNVVFHTVGTEGPE